MSLYQQVHKLILATHSEYFKALFRIDMKENVENKVEFKFSVPNMDAIIEYMYTEEMELTEDNISEMINISCYLQVYIIIIFNYLIFIVDNILKYIFIL